MAKRTENYRLILLLIVIIILLAFLVEESVAFGAGNIPSYAFLEVSSNLNRSNPVLSPYYTLS
jgi:hypothetical protein